MSNKNLYEQKMKAQLQLWEAEADKLMARASIASADVQLEMKKMAGGLNKKVKEGKRKLFDIGESGEDAWEKLKDSAEATWKSIHTAFGEAAAKFKE